MSFNAGEVYAELGGRFNPKDFAAFGVAMNKAGADMQRTEKRMNDSTSRMGRGIDRVGAAARTGMVGGLGVAAVGVGALAVGMVKAADKAAQFEAGMRNVNTIAKLSEGGLKDLSKEVLALSAKTGQKPKALTEGLYDIVSSGFKAKDALTILAASSDAATAGLTDTATSTKAVVSVLNAYQLPASAAAKVSDQLFGIVDSGVISFEELASQIGDVLPFASSMGIGLDQLGGAIATITKGGVSGAQSMTQLKGVFTQLLSPSEALKAAIKETGSASAESLLKTKGLEGTLLALEGTTDGSKAAMQKLFPSVEALGAVLRLTGKNATLAKSDLAAMQNVTGKTGAALEEQSKSYESAKKRFSTALEVAQVTVGSAVLPPLTDKLTEWADGIARAAEDGRLQNFADDIADLGSSLADAGGSIASAAPGVVGAFKGMVSGIADVISESKQLASDFLGVISTIADGELALVNAYNAVAPKGAEIDTRELEANIDKINRLRDDLTGKQPPEVSVKVNAEKAKSELAEFASRFKALEREKQLNLVLTGSKSAGAAVGALKALLDGVPEKTVTNILARADTGAAQVLAFKALVAGVPLSTISRILATTKGTGQVLELTGAIRTVPQSKRPKVTASTSGKPAVDAMLGALGRMPGSKNPKVAASTSGKGDVDALAGAIAGVQSKTVTITTLARKLTTIETRRGRAAGRGAVGSERAIVGEGSRWQGAREAIVDPRTGTMRVVEGAQLADLGPSDYVIPYEDRFRGRALGLMQSLAKDMGLAGYAKGKKGKALPKAKVKRALPGKVEPLSLPLEELQDRQTKARDAYTKRRDAARDLPGKLRDLLEKERDTRGRAAKTPATKANKARDLARVRDDIRKNRQAQADEKVRVANLRDVWKRRDTEYREAKKYQGLIDRQTDLANLAATQMANADKRDDQGAYDAAKKKRGGALEELKRLLTAARKKIADGSEYALAVDTRLASNDGDILDNQDAALAVEAPAETETEADRISDTGLTDAERARLSELQRDQKLAGLTADLGDDTAIAGQVESFLSSILGDARDGERFGIALMPSAVGDIADQVKRARDDVSSLTGGSAVNNDQDVQAQLEQSNRARDVAQAEARTNAKILETFAGPGDIGTGRGAPSFVINTLHPGDPRTLTAIAAAAVGGMGYQNPRQSSRERVG